MQEARAEISRRPRIGGYWHAGILPAVAILFAIFLWGCNPPQNSPRGVVDRFIQAHYMAINLRSAEQFCTGVALSQLYKEEELTAGQAIDDSTRKPVIHYRLEEERAQPDRVMYLFLATIDVPDGGSFDKKWMITARKEGGNWKVSNYSEYD
jgi:hypothetical protein